MRAESALSLYITWPLRLGIGLKVYRKCAASVNLHIIVFLLISRPFLPFFQKILRPFWIQLVEMGFTSVIPVILKLNTVETSRNTSKHRNILQTQTHQLMKRFPILNLTNQKWILVKRFTDVNLVILNQSGSKVFKRITKVQNTFQILILRITGSAMINQMVLNRVICKGYFLNW